MRAEWDGGQAAIQDDTGETIAVVSAQVHIPAPVVALYAPLAGGTGPVFLYADGTPMADGPGPDRPDLRRLGEFGPILDVAQSAGLELDPGRVERSLRAVQVARWQSRARGKSWPERSRGVIRAVIDDLGIDADDEALEKAWFDAYPFGERSMHPYKCWLAELRKARKLVAAERKWAAARGA